MPRPMPVRSGEALLATEAFGDPADPPLLLVMGATSSMLGWPDGLCEALAGRAVFVIRFDHRDTGRSTTAPPGPPSYDVEDMAADVVAIMDAYGLPKAGLAGMSLGGLIAQMVALDHPDRVTALTLIASEPLGWDGGPLPHIAPSILEHFGRLGGLDWADEDAVAEFLVELDRLCAAGDPAFDAAASRRSVARVLDRTDSPASMFNHAVLSTRRDWTGRFRSVAAPVLVIHGEDDPVLPLPNGRALVDGIARASLVVMEGVGHALPPRIWPRLADRIARHLRPGHG